MHFQMRENPRKNILFYLSGHGFGHAVRQIEIMKEIFKKNIEYNCEFNIFVRTAAPEWLFANSFGHYFSEYFRQRQRQYDKKCWSERFRFSHLINDVGTIQKDSLNIDSDATLRNARKFYLNIPKLAETEYSFIRANKIDIVVGDITPLAFAAANGTRIPAIGITNFSWDYIYEGFLDEHPAFEEVIDCLKTYYSRCDLLLKLPYSCPLDAFPKSKDVPLLARTPYLSREDVFDILNYNPKDFENKKTAMISFGGFDTNGLKLNALNDFKDFIFLTTLPPDSVSGYPENVRYVDTSTAGISFENLFKIFDVIITKPGYGVVGDIICADSRCIYTDRGNFKEYDFLVSCLNNHARSAVYIEREKLLNCELSVALNAAFNENTNRSIIDTNGARCCAEIICAY